MARQVKIGNQEKLENSEPALHETLSAASGDLLPEIALIRNALLIGPEEVKPTKGLAGGTAMHT